MSRLSYIYVLVAQLLLVAAFWYYKGQYEAYQLPFSSPRPTLDWRQRSLRQLFEVANTTALYELDDLTTGFDAYAQPITSFTPGKTAPVEDTFIIDTHVARTLHGAVRRFKSFIAKQSKPSFRQTRGLVSTSFEPYFPMTAVTLKLIRNSGTRLPMQVVIPTSSSNYTSYFCHTLLPQLNAFCTSAGDFIDTAQEQSVGSYQWKSLALLLSEFRQTVFMDADIYSLAQLEPLLKSSAFESSGLVLWPDFWSRSTTSSTYGVLDINELDVDKDRASVEAGVMLVDLGRHMKTALLAFFLNHWGPKIFWRLFTQISLGYGDKESMYMASLSLQLPIAQVRAQPAAVGRFADGQWHGFGWFQHDVGAEYWSDDGKMPRSRPVFMHVSSLKPLWENLVHVPGVERGIYHADGSFTRVLSADDKDVEREYWEAVEWAACNTEVYLPGPNGEIMCTVMQKYISTTFAESKSRDQKESFNSKM